jgi:hypothetical protein
MAVKISDELIVWATRAGYSVSEHRGAGALEFWTDPGGEQRFFIRQSERGDDWWTLASSDRGSAERVELSAHALPVLERYLFALLGDAIRERIPLPEINIPNQPLSLPETYSISEPDSDGYRVLTERSVAIARARGRIIGMSTLVKVAHLLSVTIPDIETSYLSKDGRPLASS